MSIIPESDEEELICIFCLCECKEKNTNKFGCECGICYHEECFEIWVKKQNNCPICRVNNNHDDVVQLEAAQLEIERVNNKLNILMTLISGCCMLIIGCIFIWVITLSPSTLEKISNNTDLSNINNVQLQ